jgi:hypothetical protein
MHQNTISFRGFCVKLLCVLWLKQRGIPSNKPLIISALTFITDLPLFIYIPLLKI